MTVQKIIHDPLSLSQPAAKAVASDRQAAQDLLDTLLAHRERCAPFVNDRLAGDLNRPD